MHPTPNSSPAPRSRLRKFLPGAIVTLLILGGLALVLLPFGVQWYLEDWLREREVVNVSIEDVDINPFLGRFSVTSVEFGDDEGQHRAGHIALELDWAALANRNVRFSRIEVRDAALVIRRTESNRLLIGTIVVGAQQAVSEAEEREADSGWGIGIDQLRMANVDVEYSDPLIERALTIDSLTLGDFASWIPSQATTLDVVVFNAEQRLAVKGEAYPFAESFELELDVAGENLEADGLEALLEQVGIESLDGRLHANLHLEVNVPADNGMAIVLNGDMRLDDWVVRQPEQTLGFASLAWDGSLDMNLDEDLDRIAVDGKLSLGELQANMPSLNVNLEAVNWQGQVAAESSGQDQGVAIEGSLEANGLGLEEISAQLSTTLESLRWQGRLASASQHGWRPEAEGEIGAVQLTAGIADEARLLTAGSVNAELVQLSPGQLLSLAAIAIEQLNFRERTPSESSEAGHILELAKIEIDSLVLAPEVLAVGEVSLNDLKLWLERDQQGGLILGLPADGAGETEQETPVAETAKEDSSTQKAFSLAGVKTLGQSELVYLDRSVEPAVRLVVTPLELVLGEIDSAAPEADTPVSVMASESRYGRIEFTGQLRPLLEKPYLMGSGSLRDINMIQLDGYARRGSGYSITSGALSSDVKVSLQQDFLDANAEVTIRKLILEPVSEEQQEEVAEELGVPLDTALALLEDDEETIRLSVPVQGDMADLSVGVGDAIRVVVRKGLIKGIQSAATTYFAPLWPALAVTELYEAASALRFEEVTFAPQAQQLEADQVAYIENMAALLSKRPKVNLTVCGRSVASDVEAMYPGAGETLSEEQLAGLAALAEARQNAVKDQLIDGGIESARLVTCAAEVKAADEGPPRVVFGV